MIWTEDKFPRFLSVDWRLSMKINLAMAFIALSSVAVLAGCAGKVGRTNYYTLHLPAPPDPPPAESTHTTVAISEFRAPAYLKQGAIVYKPSPEQIGFYAYHRWAVDPCAFVTDSIIARLGAAGTFSLVKHYDGRPDADYLVSGRLEKLEEIDYEGGVRVEVAVSAQMTKLDTGTIVWSKSISEIGEVKQHEVAAVVSEMNHTMERAIDKLLTPVPGPLTAVSKVAAN
jgi:cholesterol transport system auxiliary component